MWHPIEIFYLFQYSHFHLNRIYAVDARRKSEDAASAERPIYNALLFEDFFWTNFKKL